MQTTRVISLSGKSKVVYIGRALHKGVWDLDESIWKNPFWMRSESERKSVIDKFSDYILKKPDLLKKVPELKGKSLACWCKSETGDVECHGDVLAKLADNLDTRTEDVRELIQRASVILERAPPQSVIHKSFKRPPEEMEQERKLLMTNSLRRIGSSVVNKESMNRQNTIVLFDIDQCLTPARGKISPTMKKLLVDLRKKYTIGTVGGSDLNKAKEQLGETTLQDFDYVFPENGTQAFKNGVVIGQHSMIEYLGEENYKLLINEALGYLSRLDIPKKRGTFIECRRGNCNISPIGRGCSSEERNEFEAYDNEKGIRKEMIEYLKKKLPNLDLCYAVGGQISFDVYPSKWNKSFCLQYLDEFENVYFLGDKTEPGGNDYEIYTHPRVDGHSVSGPIQTEDIIRSNLLNA